MRTLTTFFFVLIHFSSVGQELRNTEWIKIKCERKDGSKIIDHLQLDQASIKYYFQEKTVLISTNEQYSNELKYSINKEILSIGDLTTYKIDTANTMILSITEIPKQELPDDKINNFLFINSNFLFEYLKQTNQLNIIGDSLIQSDNLISPTFKGDLDKLFLKQMSNTTNGLLTGTIKISSNGNIKDVLIDANYIFSKREIEKTIRIINSTEGSWIIPITTQPFVFKIDFSLDLNHFNNDSYIHFIFHTKNPNKISYAVVTLMAITKADGYFDLGISQFNKGKFEKAANSFKKCIEIDSLNIDAYYNLASSYQKLGNITLACGAWQKLKDMGQMQGITFYNENCK